MSELKAISGHEIREDIDYNTRGVDPEDKEWRNYGKELCETLYYLKSEADEVISTIRAERDEYRYNLSCARNEIHNLSKSMKEDVKTIAELKADYKEAYDRLQTANIIKDEQFAATSHQKFKRCLDKANYWLAVSYNCIDGKHRQKAEKHHYKWLKLAEKFKETK